MELLDVVDEEGAPTGEKCTRAVAHETGVRHRTVHIWVIRREGGRVQVLLQRRASNKDSFPGQYATSVAGHVQAGDLPLESARRELWEELGILAVPEKLRFAGSFPVHCEREFYGKPFRDNEIAFVYVYAQPVDIGSMKLQKEEVDTVDWFDLEEVCKEVDQQSQKYFIPRKGLKLLMEQVC